MKSKSRHELNLLTPKDASEKQMLLTILNSFFILISGVNELLINIVISNNVMRYHTIIYINEFNSFPYGKK